MSGSLLFIRDNYWNNNSGRGTDKQGQEQVRKQKRDRKDRAGTHSYTHREGRETKE